MIIKHFALPKEPNQSFQIRRDYTPKHQLIWHYHEELELIHIIKGVGTLFIGDCIKSFQAGDTVLIGSQIPHYWMFEKTYTLDEQVEPIDCIVLHFNKDLGINNILNAPEMLGIKHLISHSSRGRYLSKRNPNRIPFLTERTLSSSGLSKLTSMLELMDYFAQQESETLTSENYSILNSSDDQGRMNSLMEHIRNNYKQRIKLEELASIAGLTENSFCRYFKQKTGKTPVQFITELRISHACTQLRNSDFSLKEICYDSGFNNFVSFHKNFKTITKMTPTQYRTG
ncbi:helix-turn-helix domain-containing protein [Sphingobacterium sp. DK4209]|uniref:Helix-turn-helix domain-containing protein n=1 Tax=Sphingobacterium zhuxiongii TaxID=2662364 RepID=A0A5Q0Q8X1_9SPHI|nr:MULTISPECIES: AraC family transcriptional regulator [unclassified Sphingobacterium]MVZ64536.1 helix-turn-helix domain-containing protein [Sphingobacterium sp. DK4209]QGA25866.1 helix-turn-helix domain-containing protein [Sphingobacterium sp. dk4302]